MADDAENQRRTAVEKAIDPVPTTSDSQITTTSIEETTNPVSNTRASIQLFPESDLSQGLVGWDGQDDLKNPQNFSNLRKWGLLAIISSMAFATPLASSMFSPTVADVGKDFGVSNEYLLSFSVTIFLLGYTVGPLFLGPLSEIYGRRVVLSVANWFFVLWQIGCALAPNITSLIIFRLLAGMGGAGSITLGAGVIADLFPTEQRGMATSIWALGPLIGPVVGPIAGGFIGETIGWRWVFWILLILGGVLSAAIEALNRETYPPVLIQWKITKLSKELSRDDLRSVYDRDYQQTSLSNTLKVGMSRPFILLFKSPIVLLLSVYMAFVYGLLYLFFTTIPTVFTEDYHWSTGISGLAYLGIGIGFTVGLAVIATTSDRAVKTLIERNGGKYEPEMRLVTMMFFSCILPISFFWYGWSANYKIHWIVPIIGMVPFGIAMMGIYMPLQTYIIDCYPAYAASANSALTAVRSLVGATLPLAGPAMFNALGLGWGNSVLGFIALAFVPVPILFNRYGQIIREKFPVNLEGKK